VLGYSFLLVKFLGIGIPFVIIVASSLQRELSYDKKQPLVTSNASSFVGSITAATTFGTFAMLTIGLGAFPLLSRVSCCYPNLYKLVCSSSLSNYSLIPESLRFFILKTVQKKL
jgi:hypothetical protein